MITHFVTGGFRTMYRLYSDSKFWICKIDFFFYPKLKIQKGSIWQKKKEKRTWGARETWGGKIISEKNGQLSLFLF